MTLLLVAFAFLTSFLLHMVCSRILTRLNSTISFMLIGGVMGCLLLIAIWYSTKSGDQVLSAGLIYGFLCELYIFLFTFVISSISVATLVWLQIDGKLPELSPDGNQVSETSFVGGRIDRLILAGFLSMTEEGSIILTIRGRALLNCYRCFRKFFGHI
jgi:hypothetical protein